MPLQFYEKVIVRKSSTFPQLVDKEGYVLGISEEGGIVCGYSVSFLDHMGGHCFAPDELESTGEFGDRSLFYDDDPGSRIRVQVTDGKGSIVE